MSVTYTPESGGYLDEQVIGETLQMANLLVETALAVEADAIFLVDTAAHFADVSFLEIWDARTEGEDPPRIIAINPKGFRTPWEYQERALFGMKDPTPFDYQDTRDASRRYRQQDEILDDISLHLDVKGKSIVVFDVCIGDGFTYRAIVPKLEEVGAQVTYVTMDNSHNSSDITPDATLFENRPPQQQCYPYGRERVIFQDTRSVLSRTLLTEEEMVRLALGQAVSNYVHNQ